MAFYSIIIYIVIIDFGLELKHTHSTKLHSFRGLCILRGSRPVMISSSTTP
ncbi:hypothetical protein Hanom_Chr09g00858141 [Helianthus anomalus]